MPEQRRNGNRPLHQTLLPWILLSLLMSGCVCDLCKKINQLTEQEIGLYIHKTAVPRGQMSAGVYQQDVNANTSAECVLSCCDNPLCNVALYTQRQCFTILCDTENPTACDPVRQSGEKFNDTLMVQVRKLEETSTADECSILSQKGCGEHQKCHIINDIVTRCVCIEGYQFESQFSKNCIPVPAITVPVKKEKLTTPSAATVPMKSCEFGLLACGANQKCVPKNKQTKYGTCHCVKGFVVDNLGKCVKLDSEETEKDGEGSPGKEDGGSGIEEGKVTTVTTRREKSTTMNVPTTTTEAPKVKTTQAPPTTTTPKVEMLTVSAGENKVIQLPDNHVDLKAFVVPDETPDNPYMYAWDLEAHPEGSESGNMEGRNTNTLKLSNLIAGLYTFRVQVTANNKFGEATINVTVKPPARLNKPPTAVIKPDHLNVKSTNTAILDGSDSTDDDKITGYKWEEISGPLKEKTIDGDASTLTLKELAPGNYTFKLTVTDSDGATNSTTANVTVIKEMDYPPKANAGSDVIIHLPQKSVVLYGNLSTDDKEIVSYEWTSAEGDKEKLAADMQGVRTPELHLSMLEVGDYTFTLKVTDSAHQTSTADVHVFVKPEENTAPVAWTPGTVETSLPLDNILLDATNSTDDQKITSYLWQQTGGQTILDIKNADQAVATATGVATGDIKVGKYEFKVTVKDKEGLMSSATLTVDIKQVANEPPVARAGGDVTLELPQVLVTLDGSGSTDDHKISDYHWIRDPKSLAAGAILNQSDHSAVLQLVSLVAGRYVFTLTVTDAEGLTSVHTAILNQSDHSAVLQLVNLVAGSYVFTLTVTDAEGLTSVHIVTYIVLSLAILNQSDHRAVLQLVNLVAGRYVFTLTVTDVEGLTSSDNAAIIVKEDEKEKDLMELILAADIADFTEENKNNLEGQLSLLLPKSAEEGETKIIIQNIQEDLSTGNLRVIFYAMNVMRDQKVRRNGIQSLKALKRKLLSSDFVLDYKVVAIDMLLCQNNCSDHGHCDLKTKLCVCEAFWTQNFFLYKMHGESNCDWSILYVVIVCFVIVITVTGAIWAMVCCCQKRRCRCKWRFKSSNKRRHRYSLLQDMDDENDNIEMKKGLMKGKIQNSSVMISESDFSSEEETIFVNQKKSNGHLAKLNGVSKQHLKTKMRT